MICHSLKRAEPATTAVYSFRFTYAKTNTVKVYQPSASMKPHPKWSETRDIAAGGRYWRESRARRVWLREQTAYILRDKGLVGFLRWDSGAILLGLSKWGHPGLRNWMPSRPFYSEGRRASAAPSLFRPCALSPPVAFGRRVLWPPL